MNIAELSLLPKTECYDNLKAMGIEQLEELILTPEFNDSQYAPIVYMILRLRQTKLDKLFTFESLDEYMHIMTINRALFLSMDRLYTDLLQIRDELLTSRCKEEIMNKCIRIDGRIVLEVDDRHTALFKRIASKVVCSCMLFITEKGDVQLQNANFANIKFNQKLFNVIKCSEGKIYDATYTILAANGALALLDIANLKAEEIRRSIDSH